MLDLAIRGGEVVDGTGAPRARADVGIAGGRIVEIGDDVGTATRDVDAGGRIVAPGFVDVHTHLDAQVFWDSTMSPSPLHGVTSVFAGNCGFSIAPLTPEQADYLVRMLSVVEGMPLEALQAGVDWNWQTTSEYFGRVESRLGVNAGFMVGHSAIRRCVMGAEGTERTCTDDELDAMCELLRAGLRAGGAGFSSSWGGAHLDADGRPVPSRHADHRELVTLASVCREFAGTSIEFLPSTPSYNELGDRDLDVMVDMSRSAQRPLNWNVLNINEAARANIERRLELGRVAAERGARVVALVMPVSGQSSHNFRTSVVLNSINGWADLLSVPLERKRAVLADPELRRRLADLAADDPLRANAADWSSYLVQEAFTPATRQYEGRVIGEIAATEDKDPFDALLDIVVADDLRTRFGRQASDATPGDWSFRAEVVRDPGALIGGSDAGAHLDMISSHNYPTKVLAGFTREHQVMSLEEAVHFLSQAPARFYGLRDRGTVSVGSAADLVVFDPDTVDAGPVVSRADLPGGAERLYSEALGIDEVFVNGVSVVDHGVFTGATAGKLLRSGADLHTTPLTASEPSM